jgi:hypothetical protein
MPFQKRCSRAIAPRMRSLLVLLVLSSGQRMCAQDQPDFLSLQKAVAQLRDAPIANSESTSVQELRERVDTFQTFLQGAPAASWGDTAAVQHLTALLTAAAHEKDLEQSRAIVADINRDLALKNKYYSERLGVAGIARGLVKVTVKTVSAGKPVYGLVVYCNPYRWADSSKPMQTFPSLSTPTETSMMPGYYRCFASGGKPERQLGDRSVAIGLDGKDTITLDIEVGK